ncbi:hypothetical protein QYM36_010925 [Artemia franciscana]|uniref:VOC domain-containing protein n=1 Tax=Artemia franciscana TaxID=6661 RepID=A0AA88HHF0_ARTSF|nr:hypothetical protein QYM36_010925 [Artemia franciscana]
MLKCAIFNCQVGKLDEIIACGEDLAKFKQLGILIDCEADASDPQTLPTNAPKDDSRSDSRSGRLYFSPEAKFGGTSSAWDISEMKQKLGRDVSNLIPFCHAVLGCDTTSHLYGIGKGKAVQLLLSNKSFRDSAAIFGDKLASLDDIAFSLQRSPLCIHHERLLRFQRREGDYHAPEKGAQPNPDTVQSDSLKWIVFYENCIACLPTTDVTQGIGKGLDQPIDGLIIGGSVGMKLKVMDYWKCAEVGLRTSGSRKISIVLAESLPGQANSHIRTFLDEHGGPGIQHIGLHTKSIVPCVSRLHQNGVQFRKPPEAYYSSYCQKAKNGNPEFGTTFKTEFAQSVDTTMELDCLPIFERYFTYRRVISPDSIAKKPKNSNPEFGTTFNTAFAQSVDTTMELDCLPIFERYFTYRRVISPASIAKKPKIAIQNLVQLLKQNLPSRSTPQWNWIASLYSKNILLIDGS